MKTFLQQLIYNLFDLAPQNSPQLYRLFRHYVDRYDGQNNDDISTNGELRFLQRSLPQCHTVFDIGANVGAWAELALRNNPAIRLHCFEPSFATYQRLVTRVGHLPNVICNNVGLSSMQGVSQLLVFHDGDGMNSMYRRTGLEDRGLAPQEKVETIRLDTVDAYVQAQGIKTIEFAKVDVEGHELEVFKGMRQLLAAGQIKVIQFEYGGCNIDARVLLKDIFEYFQSFEYAFFKLYPRTLRRIERYDQRLENLQYQNWAIVHDDWANANRAVFE